MRRALTVKTIAIAAAIAGVGVAVSAPSQPEAPQQTVADEAFTPGSDGIDYAAVTGPKGADGARVPACADPSRRSDLRPCL